MPLYRCEYGACEQPVERTFGSCLVCSSHLCADHASLPTHSCPSENTNPDEYYASHDAAKERCLSKLLRRIKVGALASLATSLRSGIGCNIPSLEPSTDGAIDLGAISTQTGGQHCNIDIEFDDGIIWLARIRLDDALLPPKQTQSYISHCEFSTLKFLESTHIPAPKVFHFASESSQNPVGVGFILMEKMNGAPLDWSCASAPQKSKIILQLAKIFLELERHPFISTGSISCIDGCNEVSGFAQVQLFDSPDTPIGPFPSVGTCIEAMITHQKKLISEGELSSLPVDHYLSCCWRMDMVPELVSYCNNDNRFFIKHFDDKGDHILVDEDFNITGIIDWEFASTEPKGLAFSSPAMLWPVGDFYSGNNELAVEEEEFATAFERLGRKDMAEIVRNGRKLQRFYFFNGGGVSTEQEEFEALFQGLRRAWAIEGEDQPGSYDSWKREALKMRARDRTLRALVAKGL